MASLSSLDAATQVQRMFRKSEGDEPDVVWFIDEAGLLNEITRPSILRSLLSGLRTCREQSRTGGALRLRSFSLVGTSRTLRLFASSKMSAGLEYVGVHDPYNPLPPGCSISPLGLEKNRGADFLGEEDILCMLRRYGQEHHVSFRMSRDAEVEGPLENERALKKLATDIYELTSGYKGMVGSCCEYIQGNAICSFSRWKQELRRGSVASHVVNLKVYSRVVSNITTYSQQLQELILDCVASPCGRPYSDADALLVLPALNDGVLSVDPSGDTISISSAMLLAAILQDCDQATVEQVPPLGTFEEAVRQCFRYMKPDRLSRGEVLKHSGQPSEYIWQSEFLLALKFVLAKGYKYAILVECKKRDKHGQRRVQVDFYIKNAGSPPRAFDVQAKGGAKSIRDLLRRSEKYRILFQAGCEMNYIYFSLGHDTEAKKVIEEESKNFDHVKCWFVQYFDETKVWSVELLQESAKDDVDYRLKWLGLFHRRKHQYATFMMRLKLPNGISTSAQVRYLASVIQKYGEKGCADVTTRQNWQIRGVVLPDVPSILKGLDEVGLSSLQSGMDNVRNPVGNPLAGIDPDEIVDTRPFCKTLSDFIIANGRGNAAITNLPRKWNVCVVGTHDLFEHPHINDLAYVPAKKDGKFGFNLLVGGFFSPKRCAEAVPLDAWVPADEVIPVCRAILETFRDLGFRGNRQKCRMMWLIDELGIEEFRAEVQKRMKEPLARAAEHDMLDTNWSRREYLGVHPQKQEGLSYVGIHVPVGRVQAAEMFELARLADEYGSGEIRLTVEQNLVLPNVPNSKVEALLKEPLLKRFSPFPSLLQAGLVACTGSQFCGQAIIETKARAQALTEELERTMEVPYPVRMHWTGCPNSCGQVQVADIGFMGCMTRDKNGKVVEGVNVFVGGKVGAESHLGDVVASNIPCDDLLPVVQDLLVERFGAKRK